MKVVNWLQVCEEPEWSSTCRSGRRTSWEDRRHPSARKRKSRSLNSDKVFRYSSSRMNLWWWESIIRFIRGFINDRRIYCKYNSSNRITWSDFINIFPVAGCFRQPDSCRHRWDRIRQNDTDNPVPCWSRLHCEGEDWLHATQACGCHVRRQACFRGVWVSSRTRGWTFFQFTGSISQFNKFAAF